MGFMTFNISVSYGLFDGMWKPVLWNLLDFKLIKLTSHLVQSDP